MMRARSRSARVVLRYAKPRHLATSTTTASRHLLSETGPETPPDSAHGIQDPHSPTAESRLGDPSDGPASAALTSRASVQRRRCPSSATLRSAEGDNTSHHASWSPLASLRNQNPGASWVSSVTSIWEPFRRALMFARCPPAPLGPVHSDNGSGRSPVGLTPALRERLGHYILSRQRVRSGPNHSFIRVMAKKIRIQSGKRQAALTRH